MKKINRLLIFLLPFSFLSCSSFEDQSNGQKSNEKIYSEETNRAFSMIENNGSYRVKKSPSTNNNIHKNELENKPIVKNKANTSIELNQYLTFHCMQNKNIKRFNGDEKKCVTHVNETLKKCQKAKHKTQDKLLNCIKSKIRA